MQTRLPAFPFLFLTLLPGCGGQPDAVRQQAEAMAVLAQIQAQTGIGKQPHGDDWQTALKAPRPAGRSADSVDPMTLVTEAEVAAILRQRGAAGDSTATGSFVVTKERAAVHPVEGHGSSVCRVWWVAKDQDGASCAQGNFELGVIDRATFDFVAAAYPKRLDGLGDEAVDAQGIPHVRVGDLAVTVVNTTSGNALSRDVLAVAAPRLP